MDENRKLLPDMTLQELHSELFRRWDELGPYKDDDFGEVQEVMEEMRKRLVQNA